MEINNSDLEKVYSLVGSGNLADTVKAFCMAVLNEVSEESLPLESLPEGIKEAIDICLKGLQNPESDLFIGK